MVKYISYNTCCHILKLCVPCILQIFIAYNQQMHNILTTKLYLKSPTCFDASIHHLQGVFLLFHCGSTVIEVIVSRTEPILLYFIENSFHYLILYYCNAKCNIDCMLITW